MGACEYESDPGVILYMNTNPNEAVVLRAGGYFLVENTKPPYKLGTTPEEAKEMLIQIGKKDIISKVIW